MKSFFDKITKTETCWIFNGAKSDTGYGSMKIDGKCISAHRVSWMIHFGEIPKGMSVCHKCDVKSCVNPEHLFLGTQKDNMQDCSRKGRLSNRFRDGHYPKNANYPLSLAMNVKNEIINKGDKKLIDISKQMGVNYQFVMDISCGRILANRY